MLRAHEQERPLASLTCAMHSEEAVDEPPATTVGLALRPLVAMHAGVGHKRMPRHSRRQQGHAAGAATAQATAGGPALPLLSFHAIKHLSDMVVALAHAFRRRAPVQGLTLQDNATGRLAIDSSCCRTAAQGEDGN